MIAFNQYPFSNNPYIRRCDRKRGHSCIANKRSGIDMAIGIGIFFASIPSKYLFYLCGPAIIAYWFFRRRVLDLRHYVTFIAILSLGVFSLLLEAGEGLAELPAALWTITYGSFIAIFVPLLLPPRDAPCALGFSRSVQLVAYWVLLQGAVGIVQYIVSGNPDAVAGTVGLLDFRGDITINQVYFGFSMLSVIPLIAFFPGKVRWRWTSVVVGVVSVVLSQSGHATIFFLVSIGMVYVVTAKNVRTVAAVLIVSLSTLYGMSIVYPSTYDIALSWWKRVVEQPSPKKVMLETLLFEARSDPKLLILGAGPGQYLSRAMLIGSGLLTRAELPGQEVPRRVDMRFWTIWNSYVDIGEGSAIAKPYNGYISLFSEWGMIGIVVYVIGVLVVIIRNARVVFVRGRGEQSFCAQYAIFYLIFLSLVASVELYFEMPAAIVPGGIMAVVTQARALALSRMRTRNAYVTVRPRSLPNARRSGKAVAGSGPAAARGMQGGAEA